MCPEKLEDAKEVSISHKGQTTQWSKRKQDKHKVKKTTQHRKKNE